MRLSKSDRKDSGVSRLLAKLKVGGGGAPRKPAQDEHPRVAPERQRESAKNKCDAQKSGLSPRGASKGPPVVVAVMGVTGSGKSTFCKTVTGREDVVIGNDLFSETSKVQSYEMEYGGRRYILVDTPGFDDTNRPDGEITKTILTWLKESFETGTQLNGVIYLHRIVDPRMTGTALRNSMMFRKLVGPDAFQNVILATTHWEKVPESTAVAREKELCSTENFWGGMMKKNSRVFRLKNTRASALQLLSMFAKKDKITLEAQDEMSHGVSIDEAAAAREQKSQAERLGAELRAKKAAEQKRIHEETERRDRLRRERLQREKQELERKRQEEVRLAREREERERKAEEERLEAQRQAWIREQRLQEQRRREEAAALQREMEEEEERRERERKRLLHEYYENYTCIGRLPAWPCDKCGREFDGHDGYYHCCHCQNDLYFHCESCGNDCGDDDHPYMGHYNVVTTYTKSNDDCVVM